MTKQLKTQILLRRDSLENWNQSSLVLKPGEVGIAYVDVPTADEQGNILYASTALLKVGENVENSTKTFKDLPFMSAIAADVYKWAKESGLYVETVGEGEVIADVEWKATEAHPDGALVITRLDVVTPAELELALATMTSYVDEKVAAINSNASDLADAIAAEQERAEAAEGALSEALTNETNRATGVEGELSAAIATEKGRAEAAEGVLTKAIADEAARATGKENELAAAIATEQGRAEAAEGVLTQAIADEKARAEAAEGVLTQAVADEKARAEAAEAGIQNQINTIMNNPDAEGAINSINEFTKYVEEHGTIAEGMRQDINKNKEDIAANAKALTDHEAYAAETYETKEDATSKKEALDGRIDELADTHATDKAAIEKTVADNKTELQGEIAAAIEAAKEDASKKAAVVLAEAQKYADDNDADTTYTAAENGGLKLTGTEFAIDDEIVWIFDCNY